MGPDTCHADWLYTLQNENGKIEPTILSVVRQRATRMGRESAPVRTTGTLFSQAAEGQGAVACLDWYSGFLFSWEVDMQNQCGIRVRVRLFADRDTWCSVS